MNKKICKSLIKFLYIFIFITSSSFLINPTFSNNNVSELDSENPKKNLEDKDKKNKKLLENLYLLGEGDKLLLKIIDAPELSMNVNILSDGTATLPLIGVQKLKGLTISEATKYIEKLLSKELITPQVELNLLQTRPILVSIIGEVYRPGIYNLDSNSSDLPTLINAIESAGGLSKKADLTNITLKRRMAGIEYKYKQTNINLRELILSGNFSQNPYLFDGDIINIKRSNYPDEEILAIASTTLSPKLITVSFLGEVAKPGTIKIKTNSTLIDGILAAGGPINVRANYNYVEILRMNKDGTGFRKRYKIDLSSNYSEKNNPILNDGDSVWVRKSKFAKSTDAIGYVASPLRDLVNIWTLFKLID